MSQSHHTSLQMRLIWSLGTQVLLHQPSVLHPTWSSLFLRLARAAGVKGNWTGLTAWETEVLQVKREVFKPGLRWNCSLLCEISAFRKKGTASLWSILSLSFSLLLQSLWATLEKYNNHQTQNKARKKKLSWFREVGKPGTQAVSLQELEKAAAFSSHLELNCHLKELSSAFIPKKKQLFVGSRQTGKHTENCFADQLLLLSPCSKWQKIETIIQSRATGRRRSAGKSMSS